MKQIGKGLLVLLICTPFFPPRSQVIATTPQPLQVTLRPVKKVYSISEAEKKGWNYFPINFDVRNVCETKIQFVVDSCAYYGAWSTDQEFVELIKWPCLRNIGPIVILLNPDKVYSKQLFIHVKKETPAGKVKFRLLFAPGSRAPELFSKKETILKEMGKFWSNELELQVAE